MFYEANNELHLGDVVSVRDASHIDYNIANDSDENVLWDSSDGYDL